MRAALALGLALVGCGSVGGAGAGGRGPSEELAASAPGEVEAVAESVRFLTRNCPYTRAALSLPFVAHRALRGVVAPADGVAALGAVRDQVASHVELLEGMGADLGLPGPGDHLFVADTWTLLDADEIRASDEALVRVAAFVADIGALAEVVEPEVREEIEVHSARLEALTGLVRPCPRGPRAVLPGQPWTLGDRLGETHEGLKRLAPSLIDPGSRAAVAELVDLYEANAEVAFEGRAIPRP